MLRIKNSPLFSANNSVEAGTSPMPIKEHEDAKSRKGNNSYLQRNINDSNQDLMMELKLDKVGKNFKTANNGSPKQS